MSGLLRIIAIVFEWVIFWSKKKHSDENERLEEVERFQQDATNRNEPAVRSQFARWLHLDSKQCR